MPEQQSQMTKQYYFDQKELQKYINLKSKLKVFINNVWLSVVDLSDLEDDLMGVGYDSSDNPKFFQYRDIEQVKAGSKVVTLDQLQQMQQSDNQPQEPESDAEPSGNEPATDPDSPDADAEMSAPTASDEESPDQEEPELEKSHYDPYMIGRKIIAESRKPKRKEIGSIVRILESPYYNVTGIITDVIGEKYEVRCMSRSTGRVIIEKTNVMFV